MKRLALASTTNRPKVRRILADRAARLLPNEADRIKRISNAYISVRYSAATDPVAIEELAKEVKRFAKARLKLLRFKT